MIIKFSEIVVIVKSTNQNECTHGTLHLVEQSIFEVMWGAQHVLTPHQLSDYLQNWHQDLATSLAGAPFLAACLRPGTTMTGHGMIPNTFCVTLPNSHLLKPERP